MALCVVVEGKLFFYVLSQDFIPPMLTLFYSALPRAFACPCPLPSSVPIPQMMISPVSSPSFTNRFIFFLSVVFLIC
jgi:hypothetical protein